MKTKNLLQVRKYIIFVQYFGSAFFVLRENILVICIPISHHDVCSLPFDFESVKIVSQKNQNWLSPLICKEIFWESYEY